MKGSGKSIGSSKDLSEAALYAKYLDYCSARVADALLRLSPDEMYLLAESSSGEPLAKGERPLLYSEIVRLATGRISTELALPPFNEWVDEYRKDPQRFESELLGLWVIDAASADRTPT